MDDEEALIAPDDPMAVYAFLTTTELRKQCKEVGLDSSGSKTDLIKRLYAYENGAVEESEEEDEDHKWKDKIALAHKGFSADAVRYERGRPDYDPHTVMFFLAQLGIGPGMEGKRVVCEVGAGTGKFTKVLLEQTSKDTEVIAVEPIEQMRQQIKLHPQRLRVVPGTAENLPLRDASVHCVVVAQAFHWFSTPAALKEFARVLVPGGSLGLIWNTRDTSEPWVQEMEDYIDQLYDNEPRQKTHAWKHAFTQIDPHLTGVPFTQLQSSQFQYFQQGNVDMVVDRFMSISAIARRTKDEQKQIEATIRGILSRYFPTAVPSSSSSSSSSSGGALANAPLIRIPYTTDVYWCYKSDRHHNLHY